MPEESLDAPEPLRFGDIAYDVAARRVTVNGAAVVVRAKQLPFLRKLIEARGEVVSRQALEQLECLRYLGDDAVKVYAGKLRAALGKHSGGNYVECVSTVGYRLLATPTFETRKALGGASAAVVVRAPKAEPAPKVPVPKPPDAHIGPMKLYLKNREVTVGDRAVALGPTEFRVVNILMTAARGGGLVAKGELFAITCVAPGEPLDAREAHLAQFMEALRKKLDLPQGSIGEIEPYLGVGYRLRPS